MRARTVAALGRANRRTEGKRCERAGDELHITHGAISHQMKALERDLGVALFRRRARGVELTEAGRVLAVAVREALDRIARSVEELRARPHRALTVSVLPALATHWLIPHLADFNHVHPDINGGRLPKTLAEMAKARLLHTPLQPWDEWFRALGIHSAPSRRGMTFSETGLLLRAAIDGLGVALSRRILAQPELDAGRLVRPVPHSVRANRSYFIVSPASAEPPERLRIFRDWLLPQARTTTGVA